jgi:glucuronokinase
MRVIHKSAYARAGLIGNPSDGYGGKTIAFTLRNYRAEVALHEWPTLEVVAGRDDLDHYESIQSLHRKVSQHGYYGGTRLIKATIKRFVDYCHEQNHSLHNNNFAIRYSSDIPQQVGLAGSSAIIIATLRALMSFYDVSIDKCLQPSLALDIERRELGIEGGLQDRVAQIYEGMVAMDFGDLENRHGFDFGNYQPMDPTHLPGVYVAYKPSSSEPTEVFHNNLRARYDAGDQQIIDAMAQFAALTETAASAIVSGDYQALHNAIDANFDLRNSICTLNPAHTEMVTAARTSGASAKYAGSGGAIVGTFADPDQYVLLQQALTRLGCVVFKPDIA